MEKFHDLIRNQALLSAACVKQSSSPPLPSVTSEKRHRCPTCGQGFHRAEHLKRHQTRHTGAKPFSCTFCGRDFSRKDRLQTHYNSCQWRGDREAPSSVPKGRRPHACATCVSSKIRCDGGNPCTQCTKKNVECQQKLATKEDTPVEKLGPTDDRVSIKALLNGGTDTFTETFNLPPSDLRVKSLQFHQKQKEAEETRPTTPAVADVSPQSIDYTGMFESFIDMNEQYLDFWNGPFGLIPSPNYSDMQLDLYNPSTNLSGEMRHGSIASESTPLQPSEQAQYVSSVNMAIYNKLWCLALDEKTRQELTSCLNFLLTPEKIPRFISMYFRNWHLNCPMLHKLSFDPSKVPTTLVISIVFVGAMYSKDQTERLAAKRLVDIAELVIFDSEIFSFDTEIIRSLQDNSVQQPAGPATDPSQDADWQTFQELQAGFLMVIAQYWAGPRIPKRRALESRLGEVIKIVRKYKYHHARHQRSDRISETLWLQKESRIRTIASIALLDCAGRIYSNFPCRMTLAEYDTDLPCKEAIFSSRHPFMQDDSIFAPRITISQAFAQLFQGKPKPLLSSSMALVRSNSVASETVPSMDASGDFTPFDLFILIHFLYTYIHSCIMTLSHNLPATSLGEKIDGHNSNPIFQDLKGALERWRQLWQALRNKETDESMKTAGMYRNSFHFWLVCQLIVSKEEAVDVITGMEVNCEDALTKLKVLFHNDNEHD